MYAPPVARQVRYGIEKAWERTSMSETPFIVQKVEWFQFRAADGKAFFVMVSSLPNGFVTAVPCEVSMTMADHSLIALAPTTQAALAQLQETLAGKSRDDIFAHA